MNVIALNSFEIKFSKFWFRKFLLPTLPLNRDAFTFDSGDVQDWFFIKVYQA